MSKENELSFKYVEYDPVKLEGLSKDEILENIDEEYCKDEGLVLTMTVSSENNRVDSKKVMYFHPEKDLVDAINKALSIQEKEEMIKNCNASGPIDEQEKFAVKIMSELPVDKKHSNPDLSRGWFFDLIERAENILIKERSSIPSLMEAECVSLSDEIQIKPTK